MPAWLTWLIVIVVVVVIVAVVVELSRRRRAEGHRAHAAELRQDASGQASALAESQRQAEEARAQAELAEAEAERAREQAETAAQAHQVEQAGVEDKVRVADQVDPDVDTKSADYQPDVWNGQRSDSALTDSALTDPAATDRDR